MSDKTNKSLESWIWDAACSIRGAKDAPKFKDYILPLIFLKRLCDVYDDEINRIAANVGSRTKAFALVEKDRKLVRFYLAAKPSNLETDEVWSVIRKLSNKIGEQLTTILRDVARENPSLSGIIDRVDFNATTHGQRDIDDDRLSTKYALASFSLFVFAFPEPRDAAPVSNTVAERPFPFRLEYMCCIHAQSALPPELF